MESDTTNICFQNNLKRNQLPQRPLRPQMGLLGRDGYWNDEFEYEPHPDLCKNFKNIVL